MFRAPVLAYRTASPGRLAAATMASAIGYCPRRGRATGLELAGTHQHHEGERDRARHPAEAASAARRAGHAADDRT